MNSLVDTINCYLQANGVNLVKDIIVPSLGIDKIVAIIGILYAIKTFRTSLKLGKVNFLFLLAQSHREIWSKIYDAKLAHIRDSDADVTNISDTERRHIIFIILNMHTLFEAYKKHLYDFNKQSRFDTGNFFNKPIPSIVWDENKKYYSKEFVNFITISKKLAFDIENQIEKEKKIKIIFRFFKMNFSIIINSIISLGGKIRDIKLRGSQKYITNNPNNLNSNNNIDKQN